MLCIPWITDVIVRTENIPSVTRAGEESMKVDMQTVLEKWKTNFEDFIAEKITIIDVFRDF